MYTAYIIIYDILDLGIIRPFYCFRRVNAEGEIIFLRAHSIISGHIYTLIKNLQHLVATVHIDIAVLL